MIDHTEADILFNKIYEATNRQVLIYITSKCGNTADIADIFQDTYFELYSLLRRHEANYVKNGEAVVMKLARQKLYTYYTLAQKLKSLIHLTKKDDFDDEYEISDETLCEMSSEEIAIDKISYEDIVKLIEQKDELTRKIFHLFYRMELSTAEIAELLEIGQSNVKHRIYRTLEEFRRKLL